MGNPSRLPREKCVQLMPARLPSEDERKRSDKDGRFWCQCAHCKRWFKHRDRAVRVCGVLLSPPEAHCLLCDDFGVRWWPQEKPMPDLVAIQEFWDRVDAESRPTRRKQPR